MFVFARVRALFVTRSVGSVPESMHPVCRDLIKWCSREDPHTVVTGDAVATFYTTVCSIVRVSIIRTSWSYPCLIWCLDSRHNNVIFIVK